VISNKFPSEIERLIRGKKLIEVEIGLSNTHVYEVDKAGFYLKTQDVSAHLSLAHDVQVLQWLHTKLPVPEVVEFIRVAKQEYLLITEIPGENCVEAMKSLDYEEIVRLLAEGLQRIHALDIANCALHEEIDFKLIRAQHNVEYNLIDEDDFDEERQGKTAREILNLLQNTRPPENDLVFNHGDYCLPNILLQENRISGFVDLSRAGIADRYNDLAIASRSIRYNLGEVYENLFFEYYGIKNIDEEKIDYYRTMDELF